MGYAFPSNTEFSVIAPLIAARKAAVRKAFDILPIENIDAADVIWEQMDSFIGLQNLRGAGGSPTAVKRTGSKRFMYEPGYFGDFITINEAELVRRAGSIPPQAFEVVPIPIDDLVMNAADQLINRRLNYMEYVIWQLVQNGTFTITGPNGTKFTDTFSLQTYSGSNWSSFATATPMADFRAIKPLGPPNGCLFNASCKAYMNTATVTYMMNNQNANDLLGHRSEFGSSFNTLADMNEFLLAADLPQIVEYDEGYLDESNTFQRYLANRTVVVIGKRPDDSRIGRYVCTRNAVNPGCVAGPYTFIRDMSGNAPDGLRRVPPKIEVHDGHNGGPMLWYPGTIVVMSV